MINIFTSILKRIVGSCEGHTARGRATDEVIAHINLKDFIANLEDYI
jgi:hypothetical protein